MFYAFNLKKFVKRGIITGIKSFAVIFVFFSIAFFVFLQLYPIKHLDIVKKYSYKYNLDTELVLAVIKTESNFKENAVSKKGASGLMQIMKPTADWAAEKIEIEDYSYNRILEPDLNIEIGCWFLSRLMIEHNGDLTKVIASYNAGSGNVTKWINDERYSSDGDSLDSIPFEETSKYVEKVKRSILVYKWILETFGGNYAEE